MDAQIQNNAIKQQQKVIHYISINFYINMDMLLNINIHFLEVYVYLVLVVQNVKDKEVNLIKILNIQTRIY
jgi:hypothetical protein